MIRAHYTEPSCSKSMKCLFFKPHTLSQEALLNGLYSKPELFGVDMKMKGTNEYIIRSEVMMIIS